MAYDNEFKQALVDALKGLGVAHPVGEEWVSYTGVIPKGGVPYCGQEVSRETYSALWNWVNQSNLVVSESEWQAISLAQNGSVAKYSSGDGASTFRVPRIVGYAKGASSTVEAGTHQKEGLPNIATKGIDTQVVSHGWGSSSSGYIGSVNDYPFYLRNATNEEYTFPTDWASGPEGRRPYQLEFDASLANPIYGNSNHVTPDTNCVLFGVYAFGQVSGVGDIDIGSLANSIALIQSSYLSLSGGDLLGNLSIGGSGGVYKGIDDEILFSGAPNASDEASHPVVALRGAGHSNPNSFVIAARNALIGHYLEGSIDGSLRWDGKSVVCVESETDSTGWYRKYADGWIEQGGIISISATHALRNQTRTFKTPFASKVWYCNGDTFVSNNEHVSNFGVLSSTLTNFRWSIDYNHSQDSATTKVAWRACGY